MCCSAPSSCFLLTASSTERKQLQPTRRTLPRYDATGAGDSVFRAGGVCTRPRGSWRRVPARARRSPRPRDPPVLDLADVIHHAEDRRAARRVALAERPPSSATRKWPSTLDCPRERVGRSCPRPVRRTVPCAGRQDRLQPCSRDAGPTSVSVRAPGTNAVSAPSARSVPHFAKRRTRRLLLLREQLPSSAPVSLSLRTKTAGIGPL